MPKFKISFMVPKEEVIEARDAQDAHNQVTKMLGPHDLDSLRPRLIAIEEMEELEIVFEPDFNIDPDDAA